MNIVTDKISMPSFGKPYKFVHVSDLHIAHAFDTDSDETKAFAEKQTVRWTDKYTPKDSLENIIVHVNEYKPDFVLFAGDVVDYYSPSNVSYIKSAFERINAPVIYSFGNHESSQSNYGIYAEAAKCGENDNPACRKIETEDFIFAVIDDSDKNIKPEQLDFMKELAKDGRPIFMLCHIPLPTPENQAPILRWGTYFMLGTEEDSELTKEFCSYVESEESNVAAIFAGHIHFANTTEFAPGKKEYCSAPSFTGYIHDVEIN